MKRILSFLLACVVAGSLAVSCGAATAQGPQSSRETGLFLKVSSVTFSLVGERDDIYLGTVPREQVTWESDNPEIVAVEDGVLTATGVGSTTIRARYNGREVCCAAGCLAQTRQELEQLEPSVLSAPKRLPPEVDLTEDCTDYDDAAIIGDSITYFLWQYENLHHYLGRMTFITRQGVSLYSVVDRFKNIYFQGEEMFIEDIVANVPASRVYLFLGCLDFQVPEHTQLLMRNWEKLFDKIQQTAPDKEIVIISNLPKYTTATKPTEFNTNLEEAAPKLKQLAAERGYGYFDLGYYVQDHYGRMPQCYSKDEFHMNDAGNLAWIKLLRYYAQFESEGGSLK